MKDFSNYASWLAGQQASQLPSVIQAAISKGSSMNQLIRNAAITYNNTFQSVFMYHYDSNQQLVDDTTQQMESIPNSVLSDIKDQLNGFKDYFDETKSGYSVGGTVQRSESFPNLSFGGLSLVRDVDTGVITDASINEGCIATFNIITGTTQPTGPISTLEVFPLGLGYTAVIRRQATRARTGSAPNTGFYYWSNVEIAIRIYRGSVYQGKLKASGQMSAPSATGSASIVLAANSFGWDTSADSASGIKTITAFGVSVSDPSNPLAIPTFSQLNLSEDNQMIPDVGYSISGDQDLIEALKGMFIDPAEAISHLP